MAAIVPDMANAKLNQSLFLLLSGLESHCIDDVDLGSVGQFERYVVRPIRCDRRPRFPHIFGREYDLLVFLNKEIVIDLGCVCGIKADDNLIVFPNLNPAQDWVIIRVTIPIRPIVDQQIRFDGGLGGGGGRQP